MGWAALQGVELVLNSRHLDAAQQRLRALGRRLSRRVGPDRRTGQRASYRWRHAQAQLGRAHTRVANLRRDGLHKLTTGLTRTYATVVVEDLNDVNAARNLAALAAQIDTAGSGPVAGRGANRKTPPAGPVATKRQPGTATAGKTGTVPPQGGTTNGVLTRATEAGW